MEISKRAQIALGLMVELAARENRKPLVLASVANKLKSSTSHLEAITARLRSKGLVEATRGPGGGYKLGRCSSRISILEIVLAADLSSHIFRDVLEHRLEGGEADGLTQRLLEKMEDEAASFLQQFSLSDLLPPGVASARAQLERASGDWGVTRVVNSAYLWDASGENSSVQLAGELANPQI
jgi:Rrf2 family transcriptional regulator, iron-sulfur cluster assembly transcription factor